VQLVVDQIVADMTRPGFRGCPFMNAAAEYPDPDSPERALIRKHREWYVAGATDILRDAGHPLPAEASDDLVLARDGAISTAYATGDLTAALTSLTRVAARVMSDIPTSPR
jgi:hypothetical protein